MTNNIYNATEECREGARSLIKRLLEQEGVSIYKLAKLLNERYGRSSSPSNLFNKITRSSFKVTELMDIADVLGYEIQFVPKTSIEGVEKSHIES